MRVRGRLRSGYALAREGLLAEIYHGGGRGLRSSSPSFPRICRKMRSRLMEAELKAAASVARGEGSVPIHQDDGEEEEESEVRGGLGKRPRGQRSDQM